jgi:Helix-turn-helix domain of resolvase
MGLCWLSYRGVESLIVYQRRDRQLPSTAQFVPAAPVEVRRHLVAGMGFYELPLPQVGCSCRNGQHTVSAIAETFSVTRPTIYRVLETREFNTTSASA